MRAKAQTEQADDSSLLSIPPLPPLVQPLQPLFPPRKQNSNPLLVPPLILFLPPSIIACDHTDSPAPPFSRRRIQPRPFFPCRFLAQSNYHFPFSFLSTASPSLARPSRPFPKRPRLRVGIGRCRVLPSRLDRVEVERRHEDYCYFLVKT